MRVKFVLLGGGEKAVEVVGQEQFGLFTVPVHKAPSELLKKITRVAPPFVAGCEPIRCGPC